MSNRALNWARKIPLKYGEKSLLTALANSFNDKKGCCYPKIKRLAEWCGCSERTIKRHLKSLICKNLIQREDVRNQFGHRITSKYTLNFDYNLNSLGDNLSCGKVQSLGDNLSSLGDNLSSPKRQIVTKDYIINQNINQKETYDFSLGDKKNEQQKIKMMLAGKFEELRKIHDDSYNLQNAKRLFFKICLEKEQPINFAESLIVARKQQICDFKRLSSARKPVATPASLFKWLEGERWLDIIKPFSDKKKASLTPFVKCSCGEEYLRGSYCNRCAELKKPRRIYA